MEKKGKKIGLIITTFVIAFFLVIIFPFSVEKIYQINYIIDSVLLLLTLMILIYLNIKNKMDMLEPLVFVSMIYIFMYFVCPIIDILNKEFLWYGYDLFKYGPMASIIAFIGYIAFLIGYYCIKRLKIKIPKYQISTNINKEYFLILLYIFCISINTIYLKKYYGFSLGYVLTLGQVGQSDSIISSQGGIGILSMLSYALPAILILYINEGKHTIIKIIMFLLILLEQMLAGFRFYIVQLFVMVLSNYYLKTKKRPTIKQLAIFFIVILFFIMFLTLNRSALRGGDTTNVVSMFEVTDLYSVFEDTVFFNFRIYRNYYGIVGKVPSVYKFCFLDQLVIGTIVMMIPRAIWPSKPYSYGGVGLKVLIGNNIASGQAYPNLGEFYYSLGIIGVVLGMLIYGYWNYCYKDKYFKSNNYISITSYSILLGNNLQLIIRGFMPSNFWMVIFSMLPIWIYSIIKFREEK